MNSIKEHMRLVEVYINACFQVTGAESVEDANACKLERATAREAVEASAHLLQAQQPGFKRIGWTCGDGDCGRIHEVPAADGLYATPVFVAEQK